MNFIEAYAICVTIVATSLLFRLIFLDDLKSKVRTGFLGTALVMLFVIGACSIAAHGLVVIVDGAAR